MVQTHCEHDPRVNLHGLQLTVVYSSVRLHVPQINATSMAPITAVQFGANRLYEDMAKKLMGGVMVLRR